MAPKVATLSQLSRIDQKLKLSHKSSNNKISSSPWIQNYEEGSRLLQHVCVKLVFINDASIRILCNHEWKQANSVKWIPNLCTCILTPNTAELQYTVTKPRQLQIKYSEGKAGSLPPTKWRVPRVKLTFHWLGLRAHFTSFQSLIRR